MKKKRKGREQLMMIVGDEEGRRIQEERKGEKGGRK